MAKSALFLDRDGTIIVDAHYPKDPKKVEFIDGVISALREIQKRGFLLFVVSNQSGVGRGLISDEEFQNVHQRMCDMLQAEKIVVQEFAYCFHKPEDACKCRKPETKLIKDLSSAHGIDLKSSFTVGDKWSDVLMGVRAGAKGILLCSKELENRPKELEGLDIPVCSDWRKVIDYLSVSFIRQ